MLGVGIGNCVGLLNVGWDDGSELGIIVGAKEGKLVGFKLGILVIGHNVGNNVGFLVGIKVVGQTVGGFWAIPLWNIIIWISSRPHNA